MRNLEVPVANSVKVMRFLQEQRVAFTELKIQAELSELNGRIFGSLSKFLQKTEVWDAFEY